MAKAKFYGTGRRKKSVARVYLVPGTGNITINKRDIDEYLGLETLKVVVRQPLTATDNTEKFDVLVNVHGGGFTGQAGAIRHGIARALLQADAEQFCDLHEIPDADAFLLSVQDRAQDPRVHPDLSGKFRRRELMLFHPLRENARSLFIRSHRFPAASFPAVRSGSPDRSGQLSCGRPLPARGPAAASAPSAPAA